MKALDYILIVLISIAVFLGSAFIFTGSEQEYLSYKKSPFNNGFIRMLAFGIPGALMLYGIRYVLYQLLTLEAERPGRKTLFYTSLIIGVLTSLLGTLLFFQIDHIL